MQKLLSKIDLNYNERWPRSGFMTDVKYLLSEQVRLRFEYFPDGGKKEIYIEIGVYETGSFGLGKETRIQQFHVRTDYEYRVESKGIYCVWIENPEQQVFDGGYVLIHVIADKADDKSALAERFYNYKYISNNGKIEKVSTLWGYREDIAMINVFPLGVSRLKQLNMFFSNNRDRYIREVRSEDSIIYEVLFDADENEEIAINSLNSFDITPLGYGYGISVSKLGNIVFFSTYATGVFGFQSNEKAT